MAATARRMIKLTGVLLVMNVAVWGLAAGLFILRWNSIERPLPPIYEAFPYGEIRIGVDASYPPFAVDDGQSMYGLDIDLGRALGEQIGLPVRFVNMGYDGLYDALIADEVDVLISALLRNPARTRDVRYTRGYYNAGLVLVRPTDSPITGMSDLAGLQLSYEFGSTADAEARQWLRRIDDFERLPYELPGYALDALRAGTSDAALVDQTSYRLYRRDYPDWSVSFSEVTVAPYTTAVRADRYAAWEAVEMSLNALQMDGTLEAIIRRWL